MLQLEFKWSMYISSISFLLVFQSLKIFVSVLDATSKEFRKFNIFQVNIIYINHLE